MVEYKQIDYNEVKNFYIHENDVKSYEYWKPLFEQAKEKNCIFMLEKYPYPNGYFRYSINFIYPCKVNIQNYTTDDIIGFYYMMRTHKVLRAVALKNNNGISRSCSFDPYMYASVEDIRYIYSDNYTLDEIINMSHNDIQYCSRCGHVNAKAILCKDKYIECPACEIKRTFVPRINIIL